MLDAAIVAARKGGEVLSRYFELTGLEREEKDDKSFVTKADKESEKIIVETLMAAYPDHGFLGEEGSDTKPDAEFRWIIDPLDGTTNFVNGIPLFAVSIAAVKDGLPVASVVYNPVTDSLYAAAKGTGTTYNGKKVTVSKEDASHGIVSFGPGKHAKKELDAFFSKTEGIFKSKRYLGATALELAYLARGGTEAFASLGLQKWDYAAGVLLILEAGGTITDFDGGPWTFEENHFIASNGITHEALKALVREAREALE